MSIYRLDLAIGHFLMELRHRIYLTRKQQADSTKLPDEGTYQLIIGAATPGAPRLRLEDEDYRNTRLIDFPMSSIPRGMRQSRADKQAGLLIPNTVMPLPYIFSFQARKDVT